MIGRVAGRVVYRVHQFLQALSAPLTTEDRQDVQRVLSPQQWELFSRMSPVDRQHGLAVFQTLQQQGDPPADVLVAALLHDVGKAAAPPPLWLRVAVVLLAHFAPRLWERCSGGEARGWRRPFVLYRQHAAIGAQWAARAGCSPLTVALIHRHEEPVKHAESEEDRLLARLQEVDGAW